MAKGSRFQADLAAQLKNPAFAAEYIRSAIQENDPEYLAQAIGNVVKARGISKVSKATHLTRQSLYKMFSPKGNPTLSSVNSVLKAVGLKLDVLPIKKRSA